MEPAAGVEVAQRVNVGVGGLGREVRNDVVVVDEAPATTRTDATPPGRVGRLADRRPIFELRERLATTAAQLAGPDQSPPLIEVWLSLFLPLGARDFAYSTTAANFGASFSPAIDGSASSAWTVASSRILRPRRSGSSSLLAPLTCEVTARPTQRMPSCQGTPPDRTVNRP
ncbi:hypothetical protein [Streptomyces laculatispora]|uniref:hypothetical protein n=1 Tax=Streptomyces laculatispora TaxID=887464 RepID=UPI001A93B1C8|nr:hypothetical protein [Streptomyces laculatispora]MBO0913408.1 hypothetical protein [Streptomyces laculatispora]